MTETLPLSACVITLNEEDNIARCLKSIQWADDILVVDSGSEDRTIEIAEKHGARVLHHDWPGFGPQKQFATDHAEHDWIFSIDADEVVSTKLAKSIKEIFEEEPPDPQTCFKVNRLANYLGQWIYHGSWHPDWVIRLFNRRYTGWAEKEVHEYIDPADTSKPLDGLLFHFPYQDLEEHFDTMNRYTDIMAKEKDRVGVQGSIFKAISHGSFKVFRDFMLKRGFLDGKRGLACAIIGGFYTFMKYLKLWERQNQDSRENIDYPPPDEPN